MPASSTTISTSTIVIALESAFLCRPVRSGSSIGDSSSTLLLLDDDGGGADDGAGRTGGRAGVRAGGAGARALGVGEPCATCGAATGRLWSARSAAHDEVS